MKVYQCDACGKVIKDPYEEKMKEFCVVAHFDVGGVFPEFTKRKEKVHLCEECFKGLHLIAEKKRSDSQEYPCVYKHTCGHDFCVMSECPDYEPKTKGKKWFEEEGADNG